MATTVTGTTYNAQQQTFALSMMSNLASGTQKVNATSAQEAAQQIEGVLQNYLTEIFANANNPANANTNDPIYNCLNGWQLAWGPSVYVDISDFNQSAGTAAATQAMFVAGNGNNYVLAIAGTNPASTFDIKSEDGGISPVTWAFGNPTNGWPRITSGTNKALNIMSTMTNQNQTNGTTVISFLEGLPSGTTFTVTGHSLGGGLTPAFATAMFNSKSTLSSILPQKTNKSNNWTIRIYPTAAPDIGNADYITLVRDSFPATAPPNPAPTGWTPYQQWNQKIWNSLDVVPQVWATGFVKTIGSIYASNNLPTPSYVNCILSRAKDLLDINLVSYEPLDPNGWGEFAGAFETITPPSCTVPAGTVEFVTEMLYQHTVAYSLPSGIGIAPVTAAIYALLGITPGFNACAVATQLCNSKIAGCSCS